MPKKSVVNMDRDFDLPLKAQVSWEPTAKAVQLATLNADDEAVLEATTEANGWFVDLDRNGINELIRNLRAARDAVFGHDE